MRTWHRLGALVAVVGAVGAAAAPAHAQTPARAPRLSGVLHDSLPPDYLAGLAASDTAALRQPAAPVSLPGLDVVRGARVPDYAAGFTPDPPEGVPIPPPPVGEPPAVVHGIYLNAWVFGSSRFYRLVALADTTEINAFVIDVKDATGHVTYRSGVPTAVAIGANGLVRAPDAETRLQLLHQHGIYPIARIVVARDPLLARGKPQYAVVDANGGLWRDGLHEPWVDAYNDSVWAYAADLAAEAVMMGFREIQFDYVRFPDEPPARLRRAIFPGRHPGETKRQAIRRQVALLQRRVEPLGVPITLDVFGLTTSADGDMGIGQNWDDLSHLADVMLPMVYPSHYPRGSYGFARPNAQPYAVVRRALRDALERRSPGTARIRPYLQAFTLGPPRYTSVEVRAQIRAVEDLGLTDWVLWNARGVYPVGAFRSYGSHIAEEAEAQAPRR